MALRGKQAPEQIVELLYLIESEVRIAFCYFYSQPIGQGQTAAPRPASHQVCQP